MRTCRPRPQGRGAKLRPDADRLKLADAVLVIRPAEAVRGEAAIRRLDNAVERLAVRPLSADLRVARFGHARGCPDLTVDRDTLGHVGGADRPIAEPVRERRRLRPHRQIAHQVVHRVARMRETVPRKRCSLLGVVLERECDARCRLRQDLVEQVQVVRMDVVVELEAGPLQPRPGDDAPILGPEADLPLSLASLVLAQAPRDVADVPGRARPEQPALLAGELLHPRDDVWRELHL